MTLFYLRQLSGMMQAPGTRSLTAWWWLLTIAIACLPPETALSALCAWACLLAAMLKGLLCCLLPQYSQELLRSCMVSGVPGLQ